MITLRLSSMVMLLRQSLAILCCASALLLAGCATTSGPPVQAGDSQATVMTRLGQPSAIYELNGERYLEYVSWPFGRRTWMAHLSRDGVLISLQQVLTTAGFGKLQIGVSSKDDVLRTLGQPYQRSYLALPDLEVWTYPYIQDDVWDSMMHVQFDKAGILRVMQNGPDDRYDRENRLFRRMLR